MFQRGRTSHGGALLAACVAVLAVVAVAADDSHGENVIQYGAEGFSENVGTKPHFVMFFAPWCGHCKRLAPVFDQLGTKYNVEGNKEEAVVAKVDCTVENKLCSEQGVTGYPTLKFFEGEGEGEKYRGPRDFEALDEFILDKLNPALALEKKQLKKKQEAVEKVDREGGDSDRPSAKKGLYELTDKNFKEFVADRDVFIKFYAPWCGHCKKLAPTWDELAETFMASNEVKIAKVDCTATGGLCGEHGVKGYPTLLYFRNGAELTKYSGARDHTKLKQFVEKQIEGAPKKDKKVAPAPEKKEEEPVAGLTILTGDNIKDTIKDKKAFIKFYAPWCGHCKRLAPTWDKLAEAYENENVLIAKLDCDSYRSACVDNDVKGYPTLLYFEDGKMITKYSKGRELENLKEFVDEKLGKKPAEKKVEEPVSENILILDETSFKTSIASEVMTFVKFYAPWCGHCKKLAPTWNQLGDEFKDNKDVKIAKVDCTQAKNLCKEEEVKGFPTLVLYQNGEEIDEYDGGRDLNALKQFILDRPNKTKEDGKAEDAQQKKEEL